MTDLGKILEGLVQRTSEGKLEWSRGPRNDRFVTSIDAITVTLTEVLHLAYRLEIANEAGETVESLNSMDVPDERCRQLEQLFVLARRSALNTDATLEKLAKALNL